MVNGLFLQPIAFIPWSNKYVLRVSLSFVDSLWIFVISVPRVFFTTEKRRAREKQGVIPLNLKDLRGTLWSLVTKHTKHAQRTRRNDFDCPSGLLKQFSPLHSLRGKTSGGHKSFTTISVFPCALLCLHGKKIPRRRGDHRDSRRQKTGLRWWWWLLGRWGLIKPNRISFSSQINGKFFLHQKRLLPGHWFQIEMIIKTGP